MATFLRESTARSLCRSSTASTPLRAFSTTPAHSAGPYSPKYVDVPQMLQPDMPRKYQPKGVLPVPRELFPPRRPDKPGSAYLADATIEPSPEKAKTVPEGHKDYELLKWKKSMAEARRRNLRLGLIELYARKQKITQQMNQESARKQNQRNAILKQPERDDEYFTKPTTVAAMKLVRGVIPFDTKYIPHIEAAKRRYAWTKEMKKARRQDELHSLYMQARNFIVTEEQLTAALDREFVISNKKFSNGFNENVWDQGAPTTLKQMLGMSEQRDEKMVWSQARQSERIKRIVETLTGGKM